MYGLSLGSNRSVTDFEFEQMDYLAQVYGSLYSIFLSSVYHAMESIPNLKASEIAPFVSILEHVQDSGLLERFQVDINARIADIQEQIRTVSARFYTQKSQELHSAPGVNKALPYLLMTDEIENAAKLLDKRFPEPLLGYAHILIRRKLITYGPDIDNLISCR